MRVEDFDSKLRQKLSHIEPDFQERDWLRFQQKFQAKEHTAWKRYLLLLLLLVTIGGVAFTYFRSSDASRLDNDPHQQIIIANSGSVDKVSETQVQSQQSELKQNKNASDISNAADSKILQNHKTIPNKYESQAVINPAADIYNVQTDSESENMSFGATPNASSELAAPNQFNANISENTMITSTVELTSKISLIPFSSLHSNYPDEKNQVELKLQKSRGISKWATGLSLTIAQEHTSFGGMIERKTNSNVSFRSGILYQNFFEKEYQNEIDFKEDNQVAFTEIAKPRHSTTEEFSNIRIKTSEVVCPLELKYTIPFSSKMAAFVFGGVQLTIQSKTVLDFDYLNHFTNQYLTESGLDQASNSSTLINNFGFGAGIQRNFAGLQWSVAGIMQKSNSNLPHITKRTWGVQGGVSYLF
ncbi:MAG: hypothetical protein IPM92_03625 [Saprospiraceae bacterium]|nr:hypothetical protein [Saprospiraceae bacterium]